MSNLLTSLRTRQNASEFKPVAPIARRPQDIHVLHADPVEYSRTGGATRKTSKAKTTPNKFTITSRKIVAAINGISRLRNIWVDKNKNEYVRVKPDNCNKFKFHRVQ